MDINKVKTDELVNAFQRMGDSHRALKSFLKENKDHLSKPLVTKLTTLSQTLVDQQQELIDFAFEEIIRKKGKSKV